MVLPIELIWIIPVLGAFILGLCPKPVWSYSSIAIFLITILAYFVSCYHKEKQGLLIVAILMALPYVLGLTILFAIIGAKVRKLDNKNCRTTTMLITTFCILCISVYSLFQIYNIRKDKHLIEEAIKQVNSNQLILNQVGLNPKSTLFNQKFNEQQELESLEIRVKGKKVLYALIDINKEKSSNLLQIKCITSLSPNKRIKNWQKSCLK